MAKDPVCGMDVTDRNYTSQHKNQDYAFCSQQCKSEFDRSPERYSSASGANPEGIGPQGQRGGSSGGGSSSDESPRGGQKKKFGT